MRYHDLGVKDAHNQWQAIRWALFVFPDIRDVQPTDESDSSASITRGGARTRMSGPWRWPSNDSTPWSQRAAAPMKRAA
jgi:hypothetical protein